MSEKNPGGAYLFRLREKAVIILANLFRSFKSPSIAEDSIKFLFPKIMSILAFSKIDLRAIFKN